jgi:hypothetical protein
MSYDRLVTEVKVMRQAKVVLLLRSRKSWMLSVTRLLLLADHLLMVRATEPTGKISSVEDAWLAAKRQMGM